MVEEMGQTDTWSISGRLGRDKIKTVGAKVRELLTVLKQLQNYRSQDVLLLFLVSEVNGQWEHIASILQHLIWLPIVF